MTPEVIVGGGTAGLIAFLLLTTKLLWDEHKRHDADVKAQRDEAIAGWREQSQATNRLADVGEKQAQMLDRLTRARR